MNCDVLVFEFFGMVVTYLGVILFCEGLWKHWRLICTSADRLAARLRWSTWQFMFVTLNPTPQLVLYTIIQPEFATVAFKRFPKLPPGTWEWMIRFTAGVEASEQTLVFVALSSTALFCSCWMMIQYLLFACFFGEHCATVLNHVLQAKQPEIYDVDDGTDVEAPLLEKSSQ